MKKYKTYIEPVTFWLATAIILTVIVGPILLGYALSVTENLEVLNEKDNLAFYSLVLILLICDTALLLTMAPRGWATVTLYDDKVTWKAPFRRSVTLKYDDIKYAGVDFSRSHNNTDSKTRDVETLYISAYIYLSVLPYMPRRGKEFKKVYNENGIIMFKYTEKLCPALVEKLPDYIGTKLKDFDTRIKSLHKKK